MDDFHKILLPDFISIYLKPNIVFHSSIGKSISGEEIRILDRTKSTQKYTLSNCRLSEKEFEIFSSFFRSRRGNIYSFLIRDFSDFKIREQVISEYIPIENCFEIYKLYNDSISPYKRRIKYVREKEFRLNAEFKKVDFANGIIYMKVDFRYEEGLILNCEFDVRARFMASILSHRRLEDNSILIENMELIEV